MVCLFFAVFPSNARHCIDVGRILLWFFLLMHVTVFMWSEYGCGFPCGARRCIDVGRILLCFFLLMHVTV